MILVIFAWCAMSLWLERPLVVPEAVGILFACAGLMAGAVALGARLFSMRVIVGTDGVYIGRSWMRDFVPFSRLKSVWAEHDDVELHLLDDHTVRVRVCVRESVLPGGGDVMTRIQERNRILEQIEDAHAAYRASVRPPECHALERMGADDRTWVERLHSMRPGTGAGYREVHVSAEWLWSIVEAPAARPIQRAAAAIVLGAAADAEARARLRAVALATAEPRLRATLELASKRASGNRIVRALASIESDVHDRPMPLPDGAEREARAETEAASAVGAPFPGDGNRARRHFER